MVEVQSENVIPSCTVCHGHESKKSVTVSTTMTYLCMTLVGGFVCLGSLLFSGTGFVFVL